MKRFAVKLLLMILAGAVINFGIAWYCALKSPLTLVGDYVVAEADGVVRLKVIGGRGALAIWSVRSKGAEFISPLEPTYQLPLIFSEFATPAPAYRDELAWMEYRSMQAYGWPFLSFASIGQTESLLKDDRWRREPARWGFANSREIRRGSGTKTWTLELPLRLEPVGFILNTLVHACGVWCVCIGPWLGYRRFMRRRSREKRGLCGACAYPIGVSDACTECGNPIQARA